MWHKRATKIESEEKKDVDLSQASQEQLINANLERYAAKYF